MQAIKGNRVYEIDQREIEQYTKQGFDVVNEKGEIIAHAEGKTVTYAEYEKVVKELAALKKKKSSTKDKAEEVAE